MILAETERLNIRTWQTEDIPTYAQIIADAEVMKYIGKGEPQHYDIAETYIKNCIINIAEKGWARFAVERKENKELIGFCGFSEYNNELDFGWRYAKKHWGQGYGTEAAKVVLILGHQKFKFPRIVCISDINNIASLNIIQKIGMTYEKRIHLRGRTMEQYISLNTPQK